MELNEFKDKIFDVLNDADNLGISDIETDDKRNTFIIMTQTGLSFELECRQAAC